MKNYLDKSPVVFTKNKNCFKMDIIERNRTVKTGYMRTFLTFLSVGKIFVIKGCTQQREFQRNLKIVAISYACYACVLVIDNFNIWYNELCTRNVSLFQLECILKVDLIRCNKI